ncbi:hypothetical protein B0H13DRAFT_2310204 [Mycena leptocephala]|nr:hypothetical protein B0H13DRAFT_2310204 [Mycena leptocephala]
MARYLTLFTHLCVHLLGLMGNSALVLIIAIVARLIYWVHLALVPAIWPGRILHDTLLRIEAMTTRLQEESARRFTPEMYDLSASGLRGLAVLRRVHDRLADDHRAHLKMPFTYVCAALSLYKRSRRCKHNVELLCRELDAKA